MWNFHASCVKYYSHERRRSLNRIFRRCWMLSRDKTITFVHERKAHRLNWWKMLSVISLFFLSSFLSLSLLFALLSLIFVISRTHLRAWAARRICKSVSGSHPEAPNINSSALVYPAPWRDSKLCLWSNRLPGSREPRRDRALNPPA